MCPLEDAQGNPITTANEIADFIQSKAKSSTQIYLGIIAQLLASKFDVPNTGFASLFPTKPEYGLLFTAITMNPVLPPAEWLHYSAPDDDQRAAILAIMAECSYLPDKPKRLLK